MDYAELKQEITDAAERVLRAVPTFTEEDTADQEGEDVRALVLDGSIFVYPVTVEKECLMGLRTTHGFMIELLVGHPGPFDCPDSVPVGDGKPFNRNVVTVEVIVQLARMHADNWTAHLAEKQQDIEEPS